MGLRSRQRRLQGVSKEASYDPETNKHQTPSLEDHLRASRRDLDDRNAAWRQSVSMSGLVMAIYELGLYFQTLAIEQFRPVSPELCFVFKALAIVALMMTRQYVASGDSGLFGISLVTTAAYVVMWIVTRFAFDLRFTMLQASPIPVVYYICAMLVNYFVGGNTKAEIARADQLKKLEAVYTKQRK